MTFFIFSTVTCTLFLSLILSTNGQANCNSNSPCNNSAIIYLDQTTCGFECVSEYCSNVTFFISRECKFGQVFVKESTVYGLKIYFSGDYLEVNMNDGASCTNCNIYVGTLVDIVTDNTAFGTKFPDVDISDAFDPSLHDVGSKLYVNGYVGGTSDNFEIYCIGAVSYCVTTVQKSADPTNPTNVDVYTDTTLFCDIDQVDGKIEIVYHGNYADTLITNNENSLPANLSVYPGCYFDCTVIDACNVE